LDNCVILFPLNFDDLKEDYKEGGEQHGDAEMIVENAQETKAS